MNILWLFDTCGYIIGPAMLAAGLIALAVCLWASRPSSTRKVRRLAVQTSLAPAIIGLCGALFGFVVWWAARLPESPWGALGKVCLAGLVVSALPLLWSLLLGRMRFE